MRWVISASAFLVPLLVVVAIGSCFMGGSGVASGGRPSLKPHELDELRRFLATNEVLIAHYAAKPGQATSTAIPHLTLERFDMLGCDAQGHAWYRLALPPPAMCGVLRRAAGDRQPVGPIEGRQADILLPLAGDWSYWESKPPPAGPAKSP